MYTYGEGRHSKHVLTVCQTNNQVAGKSLPQADGSAVTLELTFDAQNGVLSGFWRERTASNGHYHGRVFHGVMQLVVGSEILHGKWAGFNSAGSHIQTGDWTLRRQQENGAKK